MGVSENQLEQGKVPLEAEIPSPAIGSEAPLADDAENVEPTSVPEELPTDDATAQAVSEVPPPESVELAEEEEEEEVVDMNVQPIEEISEAVEEEIKMDWYILKVQSNRERSICDGLSRRVKLAELDRFFGDVLVPTEDVAEYKNGKRRVIKRKLYPGYICVHMAINEETWFLVRETAGVGDFTGAAGKPTPMLSHEVDRIIKKPVDEEGGDEVKTTIPFDVGDRIRIKDGTFENFEGDVDGIDEGNGKVTIMINIFGRSTPVELEHWQIEDI